MEIAGLTSCLGLLRYPRARPDRFIIRFANWGAGFAAIGLPLILYAPRVSPYFPTRLRDIWIPFGVAGLAMYILLQLILRVQSARRPLSRFVHIKRA